MIDGLKPYPEYKDSGLPWAEKVPSHWQLLPNRGLIRKRKVLVGKNHKNFRLLSLTKRGVIVRDVANGKGKWSSDMGTSQEVRAGDLVFCLFDVPETPRTVGLSPHDGMITGAYTVFECLNPKQAGYFELFYRAMDDRKLLSPLYSGLRHTIPPSRFIGTKSPQPDPEEQSAIVRFLIHANGRIEQAIRAKLKLIALLNEQKQAIIHRAVTRGLHPNAPLKPSGIPWLGDIPKHWEVAKYKHFFQVRMGQTFLKTDLTDSGELPVLSATMSGAILGYTRKNKARALVDKDDMVIPARGNSIGYVALVKSLCTSTQTTIQAKRIPNDRLTSSFAHAFGIGNKPFLYHFVQTAIPQITTREVANNPIVVPPINEQIEICAAIENECGDIDSILVRTEREIGLLREYRTRLVADVVTGKLDVRAAAAKLPVEPQEVIISENSTDEAGIADETEIEET
jgi:type I restriction enzyme S subunit